MLVSSTRPATRDVIRTTVLAAVRSQSGETSLSTTLASVAGLIQPEFRNDSVAIGTSTGRHFLHDGIRSVMHDCDLTHVELHTTSVQPDSTARLSLWRGGNIVSLSAPFTIVAGYQQVALATAMPAQAGDQVGIWVSGSVDLPSQRFTGIALRYALDSDGTDVADESDLTNNLGDYGISFGVRANGQHMLASVGDSIAAGGNINAGDSFNPYQENIMFAQRMGGNDEAAVPGWVAARALGWGFENHAAGSQTFEWGATTGVPAALARNPSAIHLHFGINDIVAGDDWDDIKPHLDTIRGLVPSAMPLYVDEVLPYGAGSAGQKTRIDNVNANLATWCEANNAILVRMYSSLEHGTTADALDNIYDYGDALHLSAVGVQRMAGQIVTTIDRRLSMTATMGGLVTYMGDGDSAVSGGAGGRTFLSAIEFVCGGRVDHFVLAQSSTDCRVQLWRDGSRYWQSELFSAVGPHYEIPCGQMVKPGDKIGMWISSASPDIDVTDYTGATLKYAADTTASITEEASLNQSLANYVLDIEARGTKPHLLTSGDSIMMGAPEFLGHYDTTMGGNTTYQPGWQAARMLDWGFENNSDGSKAWDWADAAIAYGMATRADIRHKVPTHVVLGFGVNDINLGRTWEDVESDMDTVLTLIRSVDIPPAIYVCEILPWTNGSDSQNATRRTWNANYATWCEANNVTLIRNQILGKIRSSTGELDDLQDAYDDDGVHLTALGTQTYGLIIAQALAFDGYYLPELEDWAIDARVKVSQAGGYSAEIAETAHRPTITQTIYVSPTGSNGNDGLTPSTPVQTMGSAVSKGGDGSRFILEPGTYQNTAVWPNNYEIICEGGTATLTTIDHVFPAGANGYFEGIDFATAFNSQNGGVRRFKRCNFLKTGNDSTDFNDGVVITEECGSATGVAGDVLDYNNAQALEIRNTITDTGTDAADNISTGHGDSRIVSIGCDYSDSFRVVHHVNATKAQLIDCTINTSKSGSELPRDSFNVGAGFPTTTGEDVRIDIFGGDLRGGSNTDLYSNELIRVAPDVLYDTATEDGGVIIALPS